jgi:L-lactate dehydrogenase
MSSLTNGKVAIIGTGYVGATIAYTLVVSRIAREVVLIEQESQAEKCSAEVLDIRHGIPFMGSSNVYFGRYSDIVDCDLIIMTAGRNRRPNETRLDMAKENLVTAETVAGEIKRHYNRGVVLVVANPVDIITMKMTEWLELPKGRVFGTGCILDCSRLTTVLADFVKLSPENVSATVVGEHGESQVVVWSKVHIAGIPIEDYCRTEHIAFGEAEKHSLEQQVIRMGSAIIQGKKRTHYGIAICVSYLANAIINQNNIVASVTSVFDGEYGLKGIAMSLPSVISVSGVERRLTDSLDESEMEKLIDSARKIYEIAE